MSEMIERVARAIANTPRTNDQFGEGAKEWYFAQARAAIEAMREPTEDMLNKTGSDWYTIERTWQLMIDAAITPADG